MPLIATDNAARLSTVVKHEYEPATGYTREVGTANFAAQTTLKVGSVLGIVTATGKWKLAQDGAADGSQNAAGIFIGDQMGEADELVVPATTDTKILILKRGPAIIGAEALTWDASYNTQAKKDTALAALAALGIVQSPVR